MIPNHFEDLAVLVLAAFRLTRLIGWDDLPPIERLRNWITGGRLDYPPRTLNQTFGVTDEIDAAVWSYQRPLLAHFIGCPFCQGFWVSVAVYGAWLLWPRGCMYVLVPLAISALVGLIAKQLDP